jgi:hypothetical protein
MQYLQDHRAFSSKPSWQPARSGPTAHQRGGQVRHELIKWIFTNKHIQLTLTKWDDNRYIPSLTITLLSQLEPNWYITFICWAYIKYNASATNDFDLYKTKQEWLNILFLPDLNKEQHYNNNSHFFLFRQIGSARSTIRQSHYQVVVQFTFFMHLLGNLEEDTCIEKSPTINLS